MTEGVAAGRAGFHHHGHIVPPPMVCGAGAQRGTIAERPDVDRLGVAHQRQRVAAWGNIRWQK